MRMFKRLMVGIALSSLWPAYFGLGAYAARQAPWPRSVAFPVSTALIVIALATLAASLTRRIFAPAGPAEEILGMPKEVTRQARRAAGTLILASLVLLMPGWMIRQGFIAPEGRPIAAPTTLRLLTLAFELVVLAVSVRVFRRNSAFIRWISLPSSRFGWIGRHARALAASILAGVVAVIVLDARGYSFSARKLAAGAAGSLVVVFVCWGLHRVLVQSIDRHAWRWMMLGRMLRRRGEVDSLGLPEDLVGRLRRLAVWVSVGVGLMLSSWVWDLDLAFLRFISEQPLWPVDKEVSVTIGDLTRAVVVLGLAAVAWRHMSTFFAVAIFPRIPDDPGIRFALVTLCRYAVLGIALIICLGSIHLGLEKIGVVVAALGVGLGFGLQEVVSNFVCGIILLLERPIRVGDVVTVSGMSGKVDRINIRATTITNGENQSIIVPNRAFITGDLVNWTLKDKIIRVSLKVKVAPGTDPDKVADLLVAIAREDPDVLRNPAPSALMEEFCDSSLMFNLSAHVPEPGVAGRVKHRLFTQIQRRFAEAGVLIPFPTQALVLRPIDSASDSLWARMSDPIRFDTASQVPAPHGVTRQDSATSSEEPHRPVPSFSSGLDSSEGSRS